MPQNLKYKIMYGPITLQLVELQGVSLYLHTNTPNICELADPDLCECLQQQANVFTIRNNSKDTR